MTFLLYSFKAPMTMPTRKHLWPSNKREGMKLQMEKKSEPQCGIRNPFPLLMYMQVGSQYFACGNHISPYFHMQNYSDFFKIWFNCICYFYFKNYILLKFKTWYFERRKMISLNHTWIVIYMRVRWKNMSYFFWEKKIELLNHT